MITIREACEKFSLSKSTLGKWVQEGKIPSVRVGWVQLVNSDDLVGIRPKFENLYSKFSREKTLETMDRIRNLRLSMGMNQKEFAKRCRVSSSRIYRAENGITLSNELYMTIQRLERGLPF